MRNEKQKNEEIKKSARTILLYKYNNKSKEKEEKREKNKKDN